MLRSAEDRTEVAVDANRRFYDALWSASYVIPPQRFNTWSLLGRLAASLPARLEIGPGLRPRLPIAGTHFIDISRPALSCLKDRGGFAALGEITALPFPDYTFDLICAFDIVEHVEDDQQVFREIARIAKDNATIILSVPLHSARWTAFDTLVGHVRRYDPDDLLAILRAHGFVLEQSAIFGMQPQRRWLLDFGVWCLTRWRAHAMHWYNALLLPLGLLLQKRLAWAPGLIDAANVDELLLICHRGARHATQGHPLGTPNESQATLQVRCMQEKSSETLNRWASSHVPCEQSDGSPRLYSVPPQTSIQWHFTIDVDWIPGSQVGLDGLLDFCDRWKLKATIFFAGRFAEAYPDLVRECWLRGHELGTHGWEHGGLEQDEDFRSAPYERQREWIRRSTEAVEKASGVRPVVFRAPNLWISETTLRALEDEGYRYDSSVPAWRFDCGFGRVHYLKYFRAPSQPYRLSSSHLRLPGTSSIIEVAPSAFLFPANLATLRVLGLPVLKWMIRRIARRSSQLVFYCHPSEFVHADQQVFPRNMSKWNRDGMRPENFVLLDTFVTHMIRMGYSPALFSDASPTLLTRPRQPYYKEVR